MARPVGSLVRQRIIQIIADSGKDYGYNIHKKYCELFGHTSRELVYYHLRKGVKQGEFIILDSPIEKGNFSWGPEVRKIIYGLGEHAVIPK